MAVEFIREGTAAQQAIIGQAKDRIHFPWDRLTQYTRVLVGWMNLNTAAQLELVAKTLSASTGKRPGSALEEHPHDPAKIPGHIHETDAEGNEGHGILRYVEGRWMIAGMFWSDGRIYIDISLESQPAVAQEVFSAECAHLVDYGLPLTDQMKAELGKLFHPGGADTHTWWERQSYGSEYYTLMGEGFMAMFTHAYSDMEPWQDAFTHKSTRAMAADVHRILGVQPTTGGTPPPPPPPPPPPQGSDTATRARFYGWVETLRSNRGLPELRITAALERSAEANLAGQGVAALNGEWTPYAAGYEAITRHFTTDTSAASVVYNPAMREIGVAAIRAGDKMRLTAHLTAMAADPTVKHLKGYRVAHKAGPGTHYEKQWSTLALASRVVRLPLSQAKAQGLALCRVCRPGASG